MSDVIYKPPGRKSKCPEREVLLELYKTHSAQEIAEMYNVTAGSVMRWLHDERKKPENQGYEVLLLPEKKSIHPDFYIFAVDFDGVLCKDCYPEIGELNLNLIQECKQRQAEGHKIILWTNRSDNLPAKNGTRDYLTEAIAICKEHSLIFDAINTNLQAVIDHFKNSNPSPKITADIFVDDRNIKYRF